MKLKTKAKEEYKTVKDNRWLKNFRENHEGRTPSEHAIWERLKRLEIKNSFSEKEQRFLNLYKGSNFRAPEPRSDNE